MAVISFDIGPQGEDNLERIMDRMMDDIIDKIFAESQENFIRYGKWDTGFAARSGNIERQFLLKKMVYSAPYMRNIEFGRDPGTMPPREPIKKWLMRKMGMSEDEAESVSWVIAMKIKTRGIEPTPIVRDAIKLVKVEYGGM